MRRTEWQSEIDDAMRREDWSLDRGRRLVKVVRYGAIMNDPGRARVVGYVTQERYLIGKTPRDIEIALGLRAFELLSGCRVYRLERLPQHSEYTYELTAAMPDGLAFNPADALEAHFRPTESGIGRHYPSGSPTIPQWKVNVAIPLIHLIDLGPPMQYPRDFAERGIRSP
jgi:hypothetical protein